ncbi:MAG: NapC/NirT family cytochrome c [Actinomycetota bacterium]
MVRWPDMSKPATRLKVILIVLMVVIIIVAIVATALAFTCTPTFCADICHSMKADAEAWRKSSHAHVNCLACHVEPGLIALIKDKLMASKGVYFEITGTYHKPINAHSHLAEELPSHPCERCHAIEKRKVTSSPGVIISHKPHIERHIGCARCHNRVAHPGIKGYEDFMAMEGCYRNPRECHGLVGAKAPGKCEACHPPGFELKPKNHLVATFLLAPKPGVRADHAKMAKEEKKYCEMCHIDKFCTDCHGMEIPHPEKFVKKEHGPMGKTKPESCVKCHPEPKFCDACHHEGYKPELGPMASKGHPPLVREKGAESCFKCHGPTYCAHCHVRGEKYPTIKGP